MRRQTAGVCALVFWATILPAQQHGTDPIQLDTGARIYSSTCSVCHGPEGDQVAGIEFKKGRFRRASTDDDLARVIVTGVPGTAMPPNNIAGANLVALLAYIRSMRDFQAKPVALGDAGNGKAIFEGKGGCLECHRVNGKGSHLALDLSDIGAIRTPGYIQEAILNPQSSNLPQHRMIRAVTASGEVISGRRLNEDTLTVQVIDSQDRLVSLSKADLKELTVEKDSRMPSFRDRLTDAERADLIGYLASLNGGGQPPAGGRGRGGRGQ